MTFGLRSLVSKKTTLNRTQPYSLLKYESTPLSNTLLKRLFNQMDIAKSNVQNRLTNSAFKVPFNSFHKNRVSRCIEYWFKKNSWWMVQGKHKCYKYKKSNISKRPNFDFSSMSSSSSSENSESDIDNEVEHV